MTTPTIPRIARALPDDLELQRGGHSPESGQMCFNEAAAFRAGLDWSDAPPCVSSVIRAFTLRLNDNWSDADRRRLVPYVDQVIGTATTWDDERTRAYLAADWLMRTASPAWLRLTGNTDDAIILEGLARVVDPITAAEARTVARAVRERVAVNYAEHWAAVRSAAAKIFIPAVVAEVVVAEVVEAAVAAVAVAAVAEVVVAAVAVAEVAVAEVAVAAVAVAEVAEVVVRRALAASTLARLGSSRATRLEKLFADVKSQLPKNASYWQVREITYPLARAMFDEALAGDGVDVAAVREELKVGAIQLLERMIAVGRVEPVNALLETGAAQ